MAVPENFKRPIRQQVHRLRSWRKTVALQWKRAKQRQQIKRYYETHTVIKVSLGAGKHVKPGWLNTDYEPFGGDGVVYLDAVKLFPFKDESVDYFYSEHMIEHIPLSSAQLMLRECCRTLKPGGKIRIATPDMMKIARLLVAGQNVDVVEYANWALTAFPPAVEAATPLTGCMVFNNFMRDWGHQFVYDEKTLAGLLKTAGFQNVYRCEINVSEDYNLRNQELHQSITGSMANEFETMVMEATK